MAHLTQQLLDVDVSATRLANALGQIRRAHEVRQHLADLRRQVAVLQLFHLVAQANDLAAADLVSQAIEKAIAAGLSWQDVAGIVNTATEQRRTM